MALNINILSSLDPKGFLQAQEGMNSIGSKAVDFGKKLAGAFAVAATAVTALAIKLGVDSVNAAIKAEAEQKRLEAILLQTEGATRKQIDALNDQADKLERVGVVSGGNVTVLQSQLATFDLSYTAISKLTPAIVDYVLAEKGATASADDFKSMTNGLAQALQGNFGALTRVGFVLDENTKKMISSGTESERADALVKVLNSTYGGFNKTLTETTEGQLIKLQNGFEQVKEKIGVALLPVLNTLIDAFNKYLVPVIVTLSDMFVKDVVPIIQNLADTIGKNLQPVIDAVTSAFGNLDSAGGDFIDNKFFAQISQIFQSIMDVVKDLIPVVIDFAKDAIAFLEPKIKALFDVIVDKFLPAVNDIIPVLGDIAKHIIETFGPIVTGLIGTFIDVATKIVEAISGLLNFITGIFTGDWEKAFDGLKTVVTSIFGAIGTAIVGYVKGYWALISGPLIEFKDKAIAEFEALKSGAVKVWDALKTYVGAIPGKLLEFFKDLGSKFLEIGKNMLLGLIDGLKDKWEDLKKTVGNVFNGVVDWAKNLLGISSPSKVFIEIGKETIEGFNKGIRDSDIRSAMKDAIQGLRDAAKEKLDELRSDFQSFRDDIRNKIIEAIDFGAAFADFEADKALAKEKGEEFGGSFVDNLEKQAEKSTKFAAKIRELTKMGLSKDAIKEVLEAGVDAGTKIADELIKGGSETIRKTNELVAATKSAANEISTQVASTFYGAGIANARDLVRGFKGIFDRNGDDWKKLKKFLKDVADDLGMTVQFKVKAENPTGTKSLTLPGGTESGSSTTSTQSSGGVSVVVNGALDPEAVARQIEQVLKRSTLRAGAYS